jgi:MarR family transcriptional regulator for hemolysin
MNVKLIEPISRKLMDIGRAYLSVLGDQMEYLDLNRYYYALTVICYYDGQLTQKALSEKLQKDKSIIVNVIDTLTEKGFVYREINPADRRQHLLKATDKAKKAVPQIIEAFEKMNSRVAENISANDMQVFESVLYKMKNNLGNFQ